MLMLAVAGFRHADRIRTGHQRRSARAAHRLRVEMREINPLRRHAVDVRVSAPSNRPTAIRQVPFDSVTRHRACAARRSTPLHSVPRKQPRRRPMKRAQYKGRSPCTDAPLSVYFRAVSGKNAQILIAVQVPFRCRKLYDLRILPSGRIGRGISSASAQRLGRTDACFGAPLCETLSITEYPFYDVRLPRLLQSSQGIEMPIRDSASLIRACGLMNVGGEGQEG